MRSGCIQTLAMWAWLGWLSPLMAMNCTLRRQLCSMLRLNTEVFLQPQRSRGGGTDGIALRGRK